MRDAERPADENDEVIFSRPLICVVFFPDDFAVFVNLS